MLGLSPQPTRYQDGGPYGYGYNYVDTFTYDANGNRKSHTRGGGYLAPTPGMAKPTPTTTPQAQTV
jgi:hypothetical protein